MVHPAKRLDYAFGRAGRAGGIDDVGEIERAAINARHWRVAGAKLRECNDIEPLERRPEIKVGKIVVAARGCMHDQPSQRHLADDFAEHFGE